MASEDATGRQQDLFLGVFPADHQILSAARSLADLARELAATSASPAVTGFLVIRRSRGGPSFAGRELMERLLDDPVLQGMERDGRQARPGAGLGGHAPRGIRPDR